MAARKRGGQRLKKGRGGRDWEKAGGISLAVVAGLFIVGMVMWSSMADRPVRNAETMCQEVGPSKVTAILVDTTDDLRSISRADILGRLEDLVDASQPEEMMIVYEASEVLANTFEPRTKVCNPGDPDSADPLISSPELIRKRLEEHFKRPLAQIFEDLVDAEEAPVSPIMETIQAISVTVFARSPYEEVPKRLILISDLMQHSEHLSLYRDPLEYDDFARGEGAVALRTDLQDVDVEVWFVARNAHARFGSSIRLIDFWERWVAEQGGKIRRVSKIDGMN